MEGQAIYINSKGEPVLIKDVNNPPAGVPPELANFLKNITKCNISFDEDKYNREKKAADDKYKKDVKAAEDQVKASKEYKDLEKEVANKKADINAQNSNIANLDAQYANKKHDKNYVDQKGTYENAIIGDNNVIRTDEAKMAKMIRDAIAKVKKDDVKIEFNCKSSDACVKASKCPLRNLSLHKGTQKIKGGYKDTTTIRKVKVDKDKLNALNTDSIYFCPCNDTDDEEDIYELTEGKFKKLE